MVISVNHTLPMASRQVFLNSSHFRWFGYLLSLFPLPALSCPLQGEAKEAAVNPGSRTCTPPSQWLLQTQVPHVFSSRGAPMAHLACTEKLHLRDQVHVPLWIAADTSLYTLLLSASF